MTGTSCGLGSYSEGGRTACVEVAAGTRVVLSKNGERVSSVKCADGAVSSGGVDTCTECGIGKEPVFASPTHLVTSSADPQTHLKLRIFLTVSCMHAVFFQQRFGVVSTRS